MPALLLSLGLAAALLGPLKPGEERWAAMSHTATAITGDIVLSPRALKTARATFPLAVAADVKGFRIDTGAADVRILKVTAPANPRLLNGNRLCAGPVRWIVVWRQDPKTLGLAAFSGGPRPKGIDSPGLCGTYAYMR